MFKRKFGIHVYDFFKIDFIDIVFLLVVPCGMQDLSFLTKDRTCTSALEGRVLTTGPPGKSLFKAEKCYSSRVKQRVTVGIYCCTRAAAGQQGLLTLAPFFTPGPVCDHSCFILTPDTRRIWSPCHGLHFLTLFDTAD